MTAQLSIDRGAGSEAEWIERIRSGDERAAEEFVREYGGRMLAVARRHLRCEADCADAVQDAFLSAFRALGSFQGSASLATWLHRIVVNSCLMKLRSQSRRRTVPIGELLPTFDDSGHHAAAVRAWSDPTHDRLASGETRAQVRACIDRLPEAHRIVILLRDIEELDTAETAELLGISPAAVKTRLHRARQALRTLLDPLFTTERETHPS